VTVFHKRSLGHASEIQNYGMDAVTGIDFTFAGQYSLLGGILVKRLVYVLFRVNCNIKK